MALLQKENKKAEGWCKHGTRKANENWIRNFTQEKRLERRIDGRIILKLLINKKVARV
jgi:hypothetical protein